MGNRARIDDFRIDNLGFGGVDALAWGRGWLFTPSYVKKNTELNTRTSKLSERWYIICDPKANNPTFPKKISKKRPNTPSPTAEIPTFTPSTIPPHPSPPHPPVNPNRLLPLPLPLLQPPLSPIPLNPKKRQFRKPTKLPPKMPPSGMPTYAFQQLNRRVSDLGIWME